MRKTLAAILTLGIALAMAGPLLAQNVDDSRATGVVVSASADSLAVRLDDGTQRTFVTDFVTTMPSAPLVEGQRVTVVYRVLGGGKNLLATSVVLDDSHPQAPRRDGAQPRLG